MKKLFTLVLLVSLIAIATPLVSMAQNNDQPVTYASNSHPSFSSSAVPAPIVSKESWGKIAGEKDNAVYTSPDGKVTYKIGDQIHIGKGSSEVKEFQYILNFVSKNKLAILLLSDAMIKPMDKAYESQTFTIVDMYMGLARTKDTWVKDAPKVAYIVFAISKHDKYQVAIESALRTQEVIPNN